MVRRLVGNAGSARRGTVAISLLATLVVLGTSTTALPPADGATATPLGSDVASAPSSADGSAELDQAARTGDAVIVDDWTTETTEVAALPSGNFQATIATTPVRQRDGDEWIELDPTLKHGSSGTIEPTSAVGDISLSGGGDANSILAKVSHDGVAAVIRTPFDLPAPTLHDDTAVYSEVLPGVDLVTASTTAGFTFNWVVKDRAAADDPRVRKLSLPVELHGLTVHAERGGYAFDDADGLSRFWIPTPTMWDSSGAESVDPNTGVSDETPLEAVEQGPDMEDQVSAVATSVSKTSITLTPDTALLDSPDVVFPVVIDPAMTYDRTRNGWTAVWNNFPSKSFWQTDHSLGAGYEGFEQNKIVRSYFRFDTAGIRGKKIIAAELNVRQIHAASCQARPTDAYRTGAIGTGTTWNNQPARYTQQGSNSSTAGCGTGTAMVGWNVTNGATTLADANSATGTFMLRARDEGDKIAWKQFDDAGAELSVTYVSKPVVPSGVTMKTASTTVPCGTSSAPAIVGSTSITMAVKVTSADGASASLRGVFRRRDVTAGTDLADIAGTLVASGGTSTSTWAVQNGRTYRFFAKNRVYWSYNGTQYYLDSAWNTTSLCYFKVDTTRPDPPTVDTSSFAECLSPEAPTECNPAGQAGTPGSFTIDTPSTDAKYYYWSLNGGTTSPPISATGGAAADITVTPTALLNTLKVWTVDGAGNESLEKFFSFKVNRRSPNVRWNFDNPAELGADSGQAQSTPLTVASGASAAPLGRVEGALSVSGSNPSTSPITGTSGVSATSAFTISAWVRVEAAAQGTTTTLISANYSEGNVFEFGYEPATNKWTAGRRNATSVSLVGSTTATPRVWTHLAATYNPTTKTLAMFVNGRSVGTVVYPSAAWVSSVWRLGCGYVGGTPTGCGSALIDEVSLFSSTLGADEIQDLADPVPDDSLSPIVTSAAAWSMDDADDAAVATETCYAANLALADLATPRFGATADGIFRALQLPGASTQQAKVSRPVVDATGSFTIAANVRPTDPSVSMVIAQQRGVNRESWTLAYKAISGAGGRWVFQRTVSDTSGTSVVEVRSPIVPDASEELNVVIGTYDRKTDRIGLFINGFSFTQGEDPLIDEVQEMPYSTPWAARGDFQIGNGTLSGTTAAFKGEIERIDVFAGAFDELHALTYDNGIWQ